MTANTVRNLKPVSMQTKKKETKKMEKPRKKKNKRTVNLATSSYCIPYIYMYIYIYFFIILYLARKNCNGKQMEPFGEPRPRKPWLKRSTSKRGSRRLRLRPGLKTPYKKTIPSRVSLGEQRKDKQILNPNRVKETPLACHVPRSSRSAIRESKRLPIGFRSVGRPVKRKAAGKKRNGLTDIEMMQVHARDE